MSRDRFFTRLKQIDALHGVALRWPWLTLPLRMISYATYRILELLLGPWHPHTRVLAQAKKMTREAPMAPGEASQQKVLFFTVRGWFAHLATEAVLAKALVRRGAAVRFFLCGGQLPQCDFKPGTDPHVTRPLCWRCTSFARRFLDALELPCSFLNDWISSGARERARRLVATKSRAELETWVYRGLDLYSIVEPSVQRSLLRGDVGQDALSEKVLRGFLEGALVMIDAIEALLDEEQPDVIVMTNGLFSAEAILLDRAQRRGIEAITYERGMPVGSVLFDRNRPVGRLDLDEYWPSLRTRPLNGSENRRLDEYLEERALGHTGVIDLWPRMEREHASLIERFGLKPEAPLTVMFTNVLWDSAVYGRDICFEGMFDWVYECITTFTETPQQQLLIRVHPGEVRVPLSESRDRVVDRIHRRFPKLPSNIRIVPPGDSASSYALLDLADAVLVYTSTMGLEASVRGRPVVVAGQTHYRGRGFTLDVSAREQLRPCLTEAVTRGRLGPEEIALARRYAHFFFLEFMQPFPWVVDTPRASRRLTFSDLAELDPGRNARMDRLCQAILQGGPFVVPGQTEAPPHA